MHAWARDRLKKMFEEWEIETPGCSIAVVMVESCLGDVRVFGCLFLIAAQRSIPVPYRQASISIRKGKKLCFFELSVKASWEGNGILGIVFSFASVLSLLLCLGTRLLDAYSRLQASSLMGMATSSRQRKARFPLRASIRTTGRPKEIWR